MELNFGISPGVNISPQNDIVADRSDIRKHDIVTVQATENFLLERGRLLRRDTGQTYVPVMDKTEIEDDTFLLVNLNETTVQAGGVKTLVSPEATLIQQRLKPNDVPLGYYNSGNMIIRKEITI